MRFFTFVSLAAIMGATGCYAAHGEPAISPHADGGTGEIGDRGPSAPPDATRDHDGGVSRPRRIVALAGPGLWDTLMPTLAVTDEGSVFVTDGRNVYSIVGGAVSTYLAEEELRNVGGAPRLDIRSLAVGPDRLLYALDHSVSGDIYVSDAPHRVSLFADDLRTGTRGPPQLLAVSSSGEALVVRVRDGLVRVLPDGVERVYSEHDLGGGTDCACESLSARGSRFYYLPGCNGNDAFIGHVDGTGVSLLLSNARVIEEVFGPSWENFGSISARPRGGALIYARRALLQVREDGAYDVLRIDPSFSDFPRSLHHCAPVAMDASDRAYLLNASWVYSIEL